MERISYQEVPAEIFEKLRATETHLENCSIDAKILEMLKVKNIPNEWMPLLRGYAQQGFKALR